MTLPTRFAVFLTTLTLVEVSAYAQAVTPAPDGRSPNGNTAEDNGALFSPATAVYTWSTTTTGFAWLNAAHWTGNPGHYPGVDANSRSIADGATNDVAAFSSMAFAATLVRINFSPSSSSGVRDNTGATGSLVLGAINYLSTTNYSSCIG